MNPKVVRPADATRYNVLGIDHIVRVAEPDSDYNISFVELHVPPGLGIPLHVHTREDEIFHVLAGRVEFTLGSERQVVDAETTVFGPRGAPHAFRATADGPARLLVTVAPARLSEMFAELSRLPAGPSDLRRVNEITQRYGVTML